MSGRFVAVDDLDGPLLPALTLEFTLRGIVFAMEVPLGSVFALVATWTGRHFVYRLPPGERLTVEWPNARG
jgi:hypothetical protein